MGEFKRVFAYMLPQWRRIVLVISGAIIIAASLSLSLLTVIPLLDVLIGGESLHSWVDRKAVGYRYGMDFAAPNARNLTEADANEVMAFLLVTNVDSDSVAEQAGFIAGDRIWSINTAEQQSWNSATMLQGLATTDANLVEVELRRVGNTGRLEDLQMTLEIPQNEADAKAIGWSPMRFVSWQIRTSIVGFGEKLITVVPRQSGQSSLINAVIFIIGLVTVVTVLRSIAKYYQVYMAEKVVQVSINKIREDAFAHTLEMPMSYFVRERPSDTVSRLINDTASIGRAIKVMLDKALREPFTAAFMLASALWINWQLSIIFLTVAPATGAAVAYFGRKMKKATRKSLVARSEMLSKLQETMSGLRVVKVYNNQQQEKKVFHDINERLLKQMLKMSRATAATSPTMEVLGMFAGAAAVIIGAQWVTSAKIGGSEFLVLLGLLGFAAESLRKASSVWNKIQEANAAAERVFAVIDSPIEIESKDAKDLPQLRNSVEFKDIYFTYPGCDKPVLKGVNLSVKAGQNVAIVGSNGSGKTTLANLLPRFFDPDSGSIFIDGYDIKDVSIRSLRDQIAMVTQQVVTFNDTIANNIAYGKHDATREDVIEAAQRARAHEFIEPLANGYDSIIGESGSGLSGGQLQRVIIARAILKNPAILIFDEATSQVDAESEAKIHQAIEQVMKDRTSFIIAHRFSTVISADIIAVMDHGRIIAQGQHEELIKTCTLYQSLYETQLVAPRHKKIGILGQETMEKQQYHLRLSTGNYKAVFLSEMGTGEQLKQLTTQTDKFMQNGEVLKDGGTSFVSKVNWHGKTIVIKRYTHRNIVHSLRHTLKKSRAKLNWLHGQRLLQNDIKTARPLGFIELHRGPLLWESYIITEFIEAPSLHVIMHDKDIELPRKEQIIRTVCQLISQLENLKISHGDLKHSNILITADGPVLIDLDSVIFHAFGFVHDFYLKKDRKRFSRDINHQRLEDILQ